MFLSRCATLVLLMSAASAHAQTRPAATTSAPATTQVARSLPSRTVVLHAMFMAAGNPAGVRQCYLALTEREAALADAYASMASAIGKLRSAANDKWGEKGFEQIGFGPMFEVEIANLEKSRFTLDGPNKALVYSAGKTSPLVLLFVKGEWKISPALSFPRNLERRVARTAAQVKAYEELAAEISAGKFRSSLEAKVAGSEKVSKAMKEVDERLGTIQPTTKPQ